MAAHQTHTRFSPQQLTTAAFLLCCLLHLTSGFSIEQGSTDLRDSGRVKRGVPHSTICKNNQRVNCEQERAEQPQVAKKSEFQRRFWNALLQNDKLKFGTPGAPRRFTSDELAHRILKYLSDMVTVGSNHWKRFQKRTLPENEESSEDLARAEKEIEFY